MKFNELSEQQILELFESAPIKDFDLIYRFYKTYINVVKVLVEAFSGYAYQKDAYELYNAFYAPQKLSYASFSRILGEMEEEGLIGSKNANKKIIYMKQKAYALMNKNQTTIHHSRFNNRAMKKAEQLTKLHLKLQHVFGAQYRPTFLERSTHNTSIYRVKTTTKDFYFFFCLKEKQKSEDLKAEAASFLGSQCDFTLKKKFEFFFVVDEEAKRYDTALAKLKNSSNLQLQQSTSQLTIGKLKI